MNKYTLVKNIIENINNEDQSSIFVEIGTHTGEFADHILKNSINSILYCIDPYTNYDNYDDAINNITGDNIYNNTYNKLKDLYGDRIIFIRKFSNDAINDIPNNIDFLYIDGNHRYNYVIKDLELYYPKVKNNSFIIGDDAVDKIEYDDRRNENGDILFTWSSNSYGHYGVIKAFNEFCTNNNLIGNIIDNQYIIKKI